MASPVARNGRLTAASDSGKDQIAQIWIFPGFGRIIGLAPKAGPLLFWSSFSVSSGAQ
jgi:hypothetical protein